MAFSEDILTRIINVHWAEEEGFHFLYSDENGMLGSSDGETWTRAETAVPASSLAWIDDVWIACDNGFTSWRSVDGGTTWQTMGIAFQQVAACKGETDTGEGSARGIFAGYREDDEGENWLIYISRNLGLTWSIALTIPITIPFGDEEDGGEFVQSLNGCGKCIFVTTEKRDSTYARGDAVVYRSEAGGAFSRQQVWSGNFESPPPAPASYPAIGYVPGGVGFDDAETDGESYSLTGLKAVADSPLSRHFSIIYATSTGGGFSGETLITEATTTVVPGGPNTGDAVGGALSTAGGDGKFVTTVRHDLTGAGNFPPVPANLDVHSFNGGSGSQTLLSIDDIFTGPQLRTVCFKKDETSSDGATGTFACAISKADGGIWIAKGGTAFRKTHSGAGDRCTIAVGKLSWL